MAYDRELTWIPASRQTGVIEGSMGFTYLRYDPLCIERSFRRTRWRDSFANEVSFADVFIIIIIIIIRCLEIFLEMGVKSV